MNARLKIDLGNKGIFEVEGSEEFVEKLYNDYKEQLTKKSSPRKKNGNTTKSLGGKSSTPKGKSSSSDEPKIVDDLNLTGGEGKKSLRQFYTEYEPSTNYERSLLFIYYLDQILKLKPLTVDAIFTCYNNIPKLKKPAALNQSMIELKGSKGWLKSSVSNDIQINIHGINYIEQDLKKSSEQENA